MNRAAQPAESDGQGEDPGCGVDSHHAEVMRFDSNKSRNSSPNCTRQALGCRASSSAIMREPTGFDLCRPPATTCRAETPAPLARTS